MLIISFHCTFHNDVHIFKPGDTVGASEATLLSLLNICPFSYYFIVQQAYDFGVIFSPVVLKIEPEDVCEKFMSGVANLLEFPHRCQCYRTSYRFRFRGSSHQ